MSRLDHEAPERMTRPAHNTARTQDMAVLIRRQKHDIAAAWLLA